MTTGNTPKLFTDDPFARAIEQADRESQRTARMLALVLVMMMIFAFVPAGLAVAYALWR